MPKRRHISASDRKRIAAVRLQGLAVAGVYQGRLARLRRAELRRVLSLCKQLDDPEDVPLVLEQEIREDYLMGWWQKLWMTAGPPAARDTAQELRQAKAAAEDNIWLQALRAYATQRAGENIVSVTGTWRESLVNLTRTLLGDDLGIGVEKLTQRIFAGYTGALQEWQCRRIAQTEALIGMAEAGNLATQQLGVAFTKQWCTSGLPNVRESHQEVDGLEVDENEPFELPGGLLMYPHDTHLGADASEIINCACACIRRPKSNLDTVTQQQPAPSVEPAPAELTPEQQREQRIQAIMKEKPADLTDKEKRALAENDLVMEKIWGITKGEPMDYEKADKGNANPDFDWNNHETSWNCQTCTGAYAMRTRGFDITAGHYVKGNSSAYLARGKNWTEKWLNTDGTPAELNSIGDWMERNSYSKMTPKRYEAFFNEYTQKPGLYEVGISWKGGGGHCTLVERMSDGSLMRIEVQNKRGYYDMKSLYEGCRLSPRQYLSAKVSFGTDGILRIDNKLFNTQYAQILLKK